MMPVKIYTLNDPQTDKPRYVGKTSKPLKERLSSHLCGARNRGEKHSHKLHWIRSLLHNGRKPEIKLLALHEIQDWEFWEQHYILLFRRLGYSLTNTRKGGEGCPPDRRQPALSALRTRFKNMQIPHTEEWNEKVADGLRYQRTPEHNKALGLSQRKPFSTLCYVSQWRRMREFERKLLCL